VEVAAPSPYGELLRTYRLAAGLTQEELAERAGLSARAISDHERGIKQRPHPVTVRMLADALGISPLERASLISTARGLSASGGRSQPLSSPVGGFLGALPVGPLVARDGELARVLAAIDDMERGRRGLTLLAGEPGVGKTRLAQETALTLQEREYVVLIGRCYGTARDMPYYPYLEALGAAWAAAPKEVRTQITPHLPHLQRLLPDEAPSVPGTLGTGPEERDRMMRAVAALLQALAARVPVAVLLDDLQWADRSSLDLLQHLTRFTQSARVFLLGTYRDVEVGPDHPLQAAIVDLQRDQLVEVVSLTSFSRTGTRALIEAMLDDVDVSTASVDLVYQRTDGNPFFVQSVLRDLESRIESGRLVIDDFDVPETVRALILQRLSTLSPAARDVVLRASILGQAFTFDDLVAAGEETEDDVEACLEEAKRAGLIRATGRDACAFSHALTHQAIDEELPAHRRRRLHLAAGLALEHLSDAIRRRRAGEIARHLLAGGNRERALVYSLLAGDQAVGVFAYAEAERFYGRAVELAGEVTDRPREAEAREKLGWVLRNLARYEEALIGLEQSAALYNEQGDLDGEGRVVACIGRVHVSRGTSDEGLARIQSGVSILSSSERSPSLPALYVAMAELYGRIGRYEAQLAAAERAIESAAAVHDMQSLALANVMRGEALEFLLRIEEALRALESAAQVAEEMGDLPVLFKAFMNMMGPNNNRGQPAVALEAARRAVQVAEQLNDPELIAAGCCSHAMAALMIGTWDDAEADIDRARSLLGQISAWDTRCSVLQQHGRLHVLRGAWAVATRSLDECIAMAERSGDLFQLRCAHALLAERDLLTGHPEKARERLVALVEESMEAEGLTITEFVRPALIWADIELGHLNRAKGMLERLIERVEEAHHVGTMPMTFWLDGMIATRETRWEDAERSLEKGLALTTSMPYPHMEGRLLTAYGQMHVKRGELQPGREKLEAAVIVLRRLGAHPDVERAEQELIQLG
jgi:tetratricopeptide (TPR) repeat protein/transcriptional regulator with XRE-family HTH domain